jgi:20S proteasome alpha/beta subunit
MAGCDLSKEHIRGNKNKHSTIVAIKVSHIVIFALLNRINMKIAAKSGKNIIVVSK